MPPSDACMYCSHPEESGRGFGEAWHLLFLANASMCKSIWNLWPELESFLAAVLTILLRPREYEWLGAKREQPKSEALIIKDYTADTHTHPASQQRWKMHPLPHVNVAAITCFLYSSGWKSYARSICCFFLKRNAIICNHKWKRHRRVVRIWPLCRSGKN